MQTKEIVMVAIGAVILTNASILGTLLATGHFSDNQQSHETVIESDSQDQENNSVEPPPPKPALHSMWQATLLCEDKVNSSNGNKHIAYQINSVASRYSEEERIYRIFIDTKTASSADSPQESAEVTCEVSSETMTVVGYKSMKE